MPSSRRGMRSLGMRENQTTTEIQRWDESEPSPKKSKKENVEKYFDDVPKKR